MNRKSFFTSLFPLALTVRAIAGKGGRPDEDPGHKFTMPPYLKRGDVIGITAPGGFISLEGIAPAIKKFEEWGFVVKVGNTIGKRDFSFGGTDEERAADMQELLDDVNVKAIMCARGGYGAVRIIDQLKFENFARKPKWIIGFSDATVFHSHLSANHHIASIHSKMCNSFPADWDLAEQVQRDCINFIRQCLIGDKTKYEIPSNPANRYGTAKGTLVGGNLKIIENLSGTRSDLQTKNAILFLEDTGEYLYSIDRMFWNLQRTGKLKQLKGLVIGGMKIKKDDEGEEFGRSLETIVLDRVKAHSFPVCFDFPVGHQKNNVALKCGVTHTFDVSSSKVVLGEY